jgi:hypothetical protein
MLAAACCPHPPAPATRPYRALARVGWGEVRSPASLFEKKRARLSYSSQYCSQAMSLAALSDCIRLRSTLRGMCAGRRHADSEAIVPKPVERVEGAVSKDRPHPSQATNGGG